MKLTDLDPHFMRINDDKNYYLKVDSLAKAQGIMFLCPKCFAANGGPAGTHSVLCWFYDRGVPDNLDPKPGRWIASGTGYADLTFTATPHASGRASVQLMGGGCRKKDENDSTDAHFHISNGNVTNA